MIRKCLFISMAVLILSSEVWGQHFDSSPAHPMTRQQLVSPQDMRIGENYRPKFRFVTVSTERNQLSQPEAKQIGSIQTFQKDRQIIAPSQQEQFQKSMFQTAHEELPTNMNHQDGSDILVSFPTVPVHTTSGEGENTQQTQNFQHITARRQTFQPQTQNHHLQTQSPSFSTSQQTFQPSTPFQTQQQMPASTQKSQTSIPHIQQQSFMLLQQQTRQPATHTTFGTQTNEFSNPAQQTAINSVPFHQTQSTQQNQGSIRTQPSVMQTFAAPNQPIPQQQNFRQTTSTQAQVPQQQIFHTVQETQPQRNEESHNRNTQSTQIAEETTLSPEELFRKQAENARYSFDSAVTDNIMDNIHIRQEKRDGLQVSGFYSYSDGFYKRTVHYVADEYGYRVTKEKIEPLGNGPQVNLNGNAVVNTNIAGINNKYSITAADIPKLKLRKI